MPPGDAQASVGDQGKAWIESGKDLDPNRNHDLRPKVGEGDSEGLLDWRGPILFSRIKPPITLIRDRQASF